MDIYVLNKQFEPVYVVDSFISFIWTDRYSDYGDFEIDLIATPEQFEIFKIGYYLQIKESSHLMIIESIQITADAEDGDKLQITGRSLESILSRRVVWGQITFGARKTVQEVIERLLTDAFMTPGNRYVSNFRFKSNPELAESPILSEENTSYGIQYTGDEISSAVMGLCYDHSLGFKMGLNDDKEIVFELYKGVDHSYDNPNNNTYVIFSPEFENVLSSNYLESHKGLKNVSLIGGEGEGNARVMVAVGDNEYTGLDRFEMFTDARDISSRSYDEQGNEIVISQSDYVTLLAYRGIEKLAECQKNVAFEGEVETKKSFIYGEDYFLGDIVELADNYGHEKKCRVVEMVVSYTVSDGYSIYPTFELIEEE